MKAGLARQNWISPKNGGYKDQPNNTAALNMLIRAIAIDETAALKSASYGAGQVLGENFALCGWPSVQAFVLDMCDHEDAHIRAMLGFMEAKGLARAMRDRDFDAIARVYNGTGQVAVYGGRMRTAYQRHAKRPAEIADSMVAAALRVGSRGYRVEALQTRLAELGYAVAVDGDFGPATRRAVVAFQAESGLVVDGIVGPATQSALDVAVVAVAPEREGATVADLRARGSDIVKDADLTQIAGGAAVVGSGIKGASEFGLLDSIKDAAETAGEWRVAVIDPLLSLGQIVANNWWLAAAAAGVVVFVSAQRIKGERLADHRTGRTA